MKSLYSSIGKSVDGARRAAAHLPGNPCAGVYVNRLRTRTLLFSDFFSNILKFNYWVWLNFKLFVIFIICDKYFKILVRFLTKIHNYSIILAEISRIFSYFLGNSRIRHFDVDLIIQMTSVRFQKYPFSVWKLEIF